MAALRSADSSGFAHLTQEISARKRDEFIGKLQDPGQNGQSILTEFRQAGRLKEKVTYKESMFYDSETKENAYQLQCVIGNFAFPSGTVEKRKQDAKHAAARKALEILLGVSTLENDSPGGESNQTAVVAAPQEPHSREQNPSNNYVAERMQSLELQPNDPHPRTDSREEDISFENLSGPVSERYKQKLVEEHDTLMEGLQLKYLLPKLYSKEVIQRAQYEEWSTDVEGGKTQKALREFLMDLPKVGNKSFHIVLDLLKEQQRWIYDILVIDSSDAAPLGIQESEEQTVPKTFRLSRAVSDPETPIQRSVASPPSSAITENPPGDDGIVSIEVVPSSTSPRAVTEYSRTMSSPPRVGIDIVSSSSSSSGVSSSTPSSGYLSGRPLRRTPSGSPQSLGRLQSVVDILKKEDLETLKESLNDSTRPPISVLKELEDKYKDKIIVEYDDVNGICCCTVNGLPYEAPPASAAIKKAAKQLAAKCAVERILENVQMAEIAKYLSGQERLIEDFHRNDPKRPPVKILEEYCKAARFPEPKYTEIVDHGRQSSSGTFTFECLLNSMRLGTGTGAAKKEAKHAAARDAFCKILRAGRYETEVNLLVSSDALPNDPSVSRNPLRATTPVTPPAENNTFSANTAAPVVPPVRYNTPSYPSTGHPCPQSATGNAAGLQGNERFPPAANQSVFNIEYYKMTSDPKGLMLIINNINFDRHGRREGSLVDEKSLIRTFRSLGFEIRVRSDLTSQEIITEVKHFAEDPRHRSTDSVILSILSHGENGKVIGSDSIPVDLGRIYEQFDTRNCPALQKKPKLFLIQACRGENWDEGVPLSTDSGRESGLLDDSARRTNDDERTRRQWTTLISDNDQLKPRIPTLADFLVAFPTVPEHLSWRSPEHGSLFISTLCRAFGELGKHGVDVCTILTQVNGRVSALQEMAFDSKAQLEKHAAQMPEFHVRLTKTWTLVPNQQN